VQPGENLWQCLHRELAEEACITVNAPTLLGGVECDHSENPAFGPGFGYPRLASQLLYAGMVNRIFTFVGQHETSTRLVVPAVRCPEEHHEWNEVLQAAFEDAVSWRARQP
jgi:NUDIX domain-containing protein